MGSSVTMEKRDDLFGIKLGAERRTEGMKCLMSIEWLSKCHPDGEIAVLEMVHRHGFSQEVWARVLWWRNMAICLENPKLYSERIGLLLVLSECITCPLEPTLIRESSTGNRVQGQMLAYETEASKHPKSSGTYDKLRIKAVFVFLQHRKVFKLELDRCTGSHHQRIICKE